MVVIRLARIGKKKQAFYRIVVADSQRAVRAKFVEIIGWYNPHNKELEIKEDRLSEWLGRGARPSNSLAILLKAKKIALPAWLTIKEKSKSPKNKVQEGEKPSGPKTVEEALPAAEEVETKTITEPETAEITENNNETTTEAKEEDKNKE